MKFIPFIFAVLSALLPVAAQQTGLSSKYGFKIKMLCAFMYLVTGILSAVSVCTVTDYALLILGALAFGFLGDFFLSYRNDRYFPLGVGFFALGHIVYITAFLFFGEIKAVQYIIPVIITAVLMFIPAVYVIRMKINLGKIQFPLIIYSFLLLFSFVCGVSKGVASIKASEPLFGMCIIIASALFAFSDIILGLKTGGMKLPAVFRHAVSYTYFPAQTLFALSIYFQCG